MRLLHAIHDFLPRHRAGSEIYAFHLARELEARGHQVTILCAEYDPNRDHLSLTWRMHEGIAIVEIVNNWVFPTFADCYRSPEMVRVLAHVLQSVGPHVLHLHSLLNLSFELPSLAKEQSIPTVATLHDFTLVCPSGGQRVHLAEEHVCREIDTERCARCFPQSAFHSQMVFGKAVIRGGKSRLATRLAKAARARLPRVTDRLAGLLMHAQTPGFGSHEVDRRLEAFRVVAHEVDHWVAPSAALAEDFRRFGMPSERLEVSDYGFPALPVVERSEGEGPLRIGFVGTLVWHKGVHILLEAVSRLPADSFHLHLFGDTSTFPSYAERLRRMARDLPVTFEGAFDSSHVADVYARIDTLVVSSLWPENSPLVIHEASQAGVPVVGSRLGGTVDLLEEGRRGLLYEADSPDDLARCLRELIDDPGLLERLRSHLPEVKSIAQDAREWEGRYREVLGDRAAP